MTVLYSNQKFIHFPEHLSAIRSKEMIAPVHIRIKPINKCNHDCWYCAYRVSNLQLGSDMDERDVIPFPKMMEIADDIVDMGVRAVTFSGGGEPLIYARLPQVIERLAAGGVKIASLTNGEALAGKMAEAFAAHGTWIRISIDGWDDKSYAESRGIEEGKFTRVLNNMRDFAKRGSNCVLGISFIVTERNCEHVYDACKMFKDAGVDHVKLSGVVTDNDVAAVNAYHANFRSVIEGQIERAKTLNDKGFRIVDHYHELGDTFANSFTSCPNLLYLTVIGADSCVYTCQDKAYNPTGLLGSIKDRSFKEFWFSEENRERIYGFNPSLSCAHHCTAHSKIVAINAALSLDPDHTPFV